MIGSGHEVAAEIRAKPMRSTAMIRPSTCFPGDDLDGYTEIYPQSPLVAYWDSEVLDTSGVPSYKILRVNDPFDVRFRVELVGPAWQCMAGDWVFDIRFDEQGGPADFKLSSKLPADALTVKNWKGCEKTCIELKYTVPANTIQDSVYELTSTFRLFCCGKPAAIVGFEPLEEYQWYS
jgi:hypothetical protein